MANAAGKAMNYSLMETPILAHLKTESKMEMEHFIGFATMKCMLENGTVGCLTASAST